MRRLVNIYKVLKDKQVPHVDQLRMHFIDDKLHDSCVYTTPVGLPRRHPSTESELCQALTCILEALSVSYFKKI